MIEGVSDKQRERGRGREAKTKTRTKILPPKYQKINKQNRTK